MKICERNFSFTIRTPHAHDRVERGKRDAHVARVRGDAVVALSENGVNTIVTVDRAASASGLALIARWKGRIVKVVTARALQKISTDGRHVSQLRACARKQRFAQNRIARFDQVVFSELGVAHHRADAYAFATRKFLDLREGQTIDVDQRVRRFHAHFHQINEVCSAAEKFCLWLCRNFCDRLLRVIRA